MVKMEIKMQQKGKSKDRKIPHQGDTKLSEIYDEFYKAKNAQGVSKRTLKSYDQTVQRKFFDWAKDNGIKKGFDIDQTVIDDYLVYLRNQDITDTTVAMYARHLKSFLNYAQRWGFITTNLEVPTVKTQHKVPETYTDEELKALLRKPDLKTCSFSEYRNWVMVNYLLATGNRLRTMQSIKIEDLDFSNRMIKLNTTKQKKAQIIPMSNKLAEILREYLSYRKGEPKDPLFCKSDGTQLTAEGISTALYRYNKRRGVEKTSIHLFRHTFAKLAIKNGIDPLRLQKILGHSTLDVTRNYVNLFGTDLKEGFNEYNPLENI